jgi:hypothetical protein
MPCRVQHPDRKGQSRGGSRTCPEDAAERAALRKSGASPSLPGSLGDAVGGHAHSRHHQAASGRHVRGRKTGAATAAAGTLPLLPVRPAHRASGRLRGSRSRVLWLRRQAGSGAWSTCSGTTSTCVCSIPTPVNSCASMSARNAAGIASSRRITPSGLRSGTLQLLARAERAGTHIGALCQALHRAEGEVGVRRILGVLALAKKFGLAAVEEACTAALELQRARISLCAPLSGTASAGPLEPTAGRSLDPRTGALPRSHPAADAATGTTAVALRDGPESTAPDFPGGAAVNAPRSHAALRVRHGGERQPREPPEPGHGEKLSPVLGKVVNGGQECRGRKPLGASPPRPPGFIAFLPGWQGTAGARFPRPLHPGPEVGAQVASLRCPILRPGHQKV